MRVGAGGSRGVTRRQVLHLLVTTGAGVLAACSSAPPPAAAPTALRPTTAPAPAPSAAAQASAAPSPSQAAPAVATDPFRELLAAAKRDGTVAIATYAGTGYRKVMDDFQAVFPGVKVEQTGFQSSSRDFLPRILQERKAGIYGWDVAIMPSAEMLLQLRPVGGLDAIRPLIVHPDVLDDKNWLDGFGGGFVDTPKQYSYGVTRARSQSLWIDTDQVAATEFASYKALLDPKWKGKIFAADLRTKGSGFLMGTTLRLKTHDDGIIKAVFKDQEPILSTDARQLTELMVRGRYPVSLGAVSKPILLDFLAQGLGKNLKNVVLPEVDFVFSGANLLHFVNRAPHPAAAQLFINWVLTREGSSSFSKNIQDNSRRGDVPLYDPDTAPGKGEDLTIMDAEEILPELQKTQDLAKAVLA